MKFKAVIFDLDDTLYDEFTFVKQGYAAVAKYLSAQVHVPSDVIVTQMLAYYKQQGREQLFDFIINKYQWSGTVDVLLERYRAQQPSLVLYPDAAATLKQLKDQHVKVGVITDGLNTVQKSKYRSLGLPQWVDQVIFTDDLGPGQHKPSTTSFEMICERLNIAYKASCYVGDNPVKDFLPANQLGMTSVRLARGMHKDREPVDKAHAPLFTIHRLEEVFTL